MSGDENGPQATLLNKKGEITYTRHDRTNASSVIDLTFINPAAVATDTIKDWAINWSILYGLDHYGIQWVLDQGHTEIDNTTGVQYSLKEVKEEDWVKAFGIALDEEHVNIAPIMDETLPSMTAKLGKKRSMNPNAKPWWNKELKAAADNLSTTLSTTQNELKVYETRWVSHSAALWLKVKKCMNFFKRLCKATKNYPMPAINRRDEQPLAVLHADKCDALREELFQPPPKLDAEYLPNLTNVKADNLPFEELMKTETREVIFEASAATAPGESQVSNSVI
ncbi:hypothetical protein K438DRAFT_2002429 [Mycena galopus ATCC 62051]|nr:hypothetical protein K438DRAFT_2002429 [Mycena galopus ATCC 62051]